MYGEFRDSVINPPAIKILTDLVEHKTEPRHFRRSEACIRNASLHSWKEVDEAAMAPREMLPEMQSVVPKSTQQEKWW